MVGEASTKPTFLFFYDSKQNSSFFLGFKWFPVFEKLFVPKFPKFFICHLVFQFEYVAHFNVMKNVATPPRKNIVKFIISNGNLFSNSNYFYAKKEEEEEHNSNAK